jgi:enterochelin esterase-like enzyme
MRKRQASQKIFLLLLWLAFSLFSVFILSSCAPETAPIATTTKTQTSTSTKLPLLPTHNPITVTLSPTIAPTTATSTIDCLSSGGKLEERSIFSNHLDEDLDVKIYLPPCYGNQPDQHYPVIILLHGLLSTNDQWLRLGLVETMDRLISLGEIPPAIVALPQEPRVRTGQSSQFDQAIITELIPWIDSSYATRPDRIYRAIGGISRGAAWAVQIGFENLDFFSRIGAHSMPLFETDAPRITAWLIQTPQDIAPNVFIDIGRDDPEWQTAQYFANQLDEYGIPHEWYFFTGGHTEDYWKSHLVQYLQWYTQNWWE